MVEDVVKTYMPRHVGQTRRSQKQLAEAERAPPDERKRPRIADGGPDGRGDDVAAEQPRDESGGHEMKTDEWRE